MISCSLHFHTTIHKYAAYLALSKKKVLHLVPKWWQLTFLLEYLFYVNIIVSRHYLDCTCKIKRNFYLP